MNRTLCTVSGLAIALFFITGSCVQKKAKLSVRLTNNLEFERSGETVTLSVNDLKSLKDDLNLRTIIIKEKETGKSLPHQLLDSDGDEQPDEVIFQPQLAARSSKEYLIESAAASEAATQPVASTFSRFVPERIDDYAWENDRVAFRTYGPEAQRLAEAGDPGGTLSSGIDCWLKRVDHPIINKWYKKNTDGTGSYHEDTGEGLDNYHVGPSRGCGGIGIWANEVLYTSKNFNAWEKLAEGPIRTNFVLSYGPWDANGIMIAEKKYISLDLGSNLCRIELSLKSDPPIEEVTIGVAIHDKSGHVDINKEKGWYSYWQPHADSELGTAIVVDPSVVAGHTEYIVDEKDKSHLYVHVKPVNGKVVYYTGFAWKKSEQFSNKEEWGAYLSQFAEQIADPVDVKIMLQ